MINRQITVRPFEPAPHRRPCAVKVRVITRQDQLWQHHYDYAVEQGNNHVGAVRYANLIAR